MLENYSLHDFKENGSSFSFSGKIMNSNDDKLKLGSEMSVSVTSGIVKIVFGTSILLDSVTNIANSNLKYKHR